MWVRRLAAVSVAVATTAFGAATLTVVPAEAAGTAAVTKVPLRTAIQDLPVKAEKRRGYDRDKFRHWVDDNGDCQDTRAEVLALESRVEVKVSGCAIVRGKWRSAYDGRTWRKAGDVDIDHLVPLAEAWDSGARRWNADTRRRFANDLADPRSLIAVTDNVNQSKGDRDPAQWLPNRGTCRYLKDWVAVKIRWRLSVDKAERRVLTREAKDCKNREIKVEKAKVRKRGGGGGGGTGGSGGSDPRFEYCYQAIDAGYGNYVEGRDPEYDWYTDADHDGVVCET